MGRKDPFTLLCIASSFSEVGSAALLGHLHSQILSVLLPLHRIGLSSAGPGFPIRATLCFHFSVTLPFTGSTKTLQSNCTLPTCQSERHFRAQGAIKRQLNKHESGPVNSGTLILIVLEDIRKRNIRYQCGMSPNETARTDFYCC